MSRASLHGLATGASTGAGPAPGALREPHGRPGAGLPRAAAPAPAAASPARTGVRLPRLARAGACALAAAFALLLGVETAQAHDEGAAGHVHLELGYSIFCPNCAHAPTGTAEPGPGYGEITLRWEPATTGPQGTTERWHIYANKQTTGNVRTEHRRIFNPSARSFTLRGLETGVTWTVGVERRRRHNNGVWAGDIAQARLEALRLTADAGDDATVDAGARVQLDGTGSVSRSGVTGIYTWTQTGGPTVALDDATSATPAFIAPAVRSRTDLTFSLGVEDAGFEETDTVTVTVLPSRVTSASVDGDALSVTFDAALDATQRPAGSAFTVTATAGSSRTIAGTSTPVAISGATATVTLSAAVAAGERLTVRYDKPASGAVLSDHDGNALPSFPDRPAGNVGGDTTPPELVSAQVNGKRVTLLYNEELKGIGVIGITNAIRFQFRGVTRTASGFSVSGKTATMDVIAETPLAHDEAIGFAYVVPTDADERIRDLAGNDAAAIGQWRDVVNVTPPAYRSAAVDGDALTITFNGALDEASVPAASAFTVKATRSGTERDVALAATGAVDVDGSTVTLTLAEALLGVDTVTVAYAAPATGKLQDADRLKLPVTGFGDTKTATNDTAADTTGPAFASAQANGRTLTITFDEALDESVTPDADFFFWDYGLGFQSADSVSISGRTVTAVFAQRARHGEDVKVRYQHADNAARRLKDPSGNEAPAFPDLVEVEKTATNVTPPSYSSASVNGSALTVTFDGGLDEASVPAGSAFAVKATRGGTERDVALAATAAVAVDDATVTLALAEALQRVDTVTVAYTAPATGAKLQDADSEKHAVPDFAAQAVTNDTPADTRAPRFDSATANGDTVVWTFDEALDETQTPVTASLRVRFEGGEGEVHLSPSSARISGRTIIMTLSRTLRHEWPVGVYYQATFPPSPQWIRDPSGNPAGFFATQAATNNTPPAFESASVDGDALTITFDGALDEGAVPAASAFTVRATHAGTARGVALAASGAVAVDGATVTLALAEAVRPTPVDTVTVAYTAPATGALQDADKLKLPVPDFAAQGATNDTPADTAAPTVRSGAVNGRTLTVTFDEPLDEGTRPGHNVFFAQVDSANQRGGRVTGVAGDTVTIRLSRAVPHGAAITFSYSKPSALALRDLSGNALETFPLRAAVNNTPPAYSSASVNGSALTITFDGGLDEASVPAASAFTVKATHTGTERGVALAESGAVAVDGATVTLALAEELLRLETVTVAYTAPATGAKLQDADRLKLPVPDFAAQAVTNDSPADTTAPELVSAQVNGKRVTLLYNEELKGIGVIGITNAIRFQFRGVTRTASGFSVSGKTATMDVIAETPLAHDEAIGFAYVVPTDADERIRDLAGNDAAAIGQWRDVVNVTPPAYRSAAVDGDALTITFNGALDEASVPAASAFTVKATRSGTERDVALAATGAVTVDDATVTLALAEAMLSLDAVTVTYTAPATGAMLQDADNAMLPVTGLGDTKTVPNKTPADTTGPAFVSAQANGNTLTFTFDEELAANPTLRAAQFARYLDRGADRGVAESAQSASISGRTVTATFATTARHGHSIRVGYEVVVLLVDQRLKDLSGNDAVRIGNRTTATNVTPPAFESASVDGAVLAITFDGGLDERSVPAAAAFTVKATRSGTERDVALAATGAVTVDDATVTLTLAEAVLSLDAVTVTYTAPATGALQDADNAMLPVTGFGDTKSVTNNTPADTTGPAFVSAQANGNVLTFTFDEALAANPTLRAAQFGRYLDRGADRGVAEFAQSASISGRTVTATFATAARHGHSIRVGYEVVVLLVDQRLKDLSGNDAVRIGNRTTATNVTPPAFESASVDGAVLAITFDGGLDERSVPAAAAFAVKATRSGTERDVALVDSAAVAVGGSTVALGLAEAMPPGDTVTVAYTAPATGAKLQDADRLKLPVPDFAAQSATNATPADTNAPAFASASVDGAALTVTFDEALDEGSTPAAAAFTVTVAGTGVDLAATAPVEVEGSAVTLALSAAVAAGQAVRVGYDKAEAGAGTLRDLVGNEAPDFAGKQVVNATAVPETRIASVAVVSVPSVDADNDGTAETYGRGEVIRVRVRWSADVLWDVSGAGAEMAVRLDVGGTARTASLLTGGAASGQARELSFEYPVVRADTDADGVAVTRTAAHDVVVLAGGATLEDTHARDASRTHAALSAGAGHKVDGARAPADTAAPVVTAAAVDAATGRTVTLTFDKDLGAMPAAQLTELRKWGISIVGAYVEGVRIPGLSPEGIAIDGRTLTLRLRSQHAAHEILPGRPVSVGYRAETAAQEGWPLRGANGAAVAAFTRTVTRAGAVEPLLSGAAVAGTKLTLTFDEPLDEGSAPAGRRFQVWAEHRDRGRRLIAGTGVARVSAKTVAVTLASAVGQDEDAWLSYQQGDDAHPLRGASPSPGVAGPVARDFSMFLHATVHDRTAPEPVSGVVVGTTLVLYYSETLDTGSRPATGAYEVNSVHPTHVRVTASAVVLTLPAAPGASVKVDYTPGTSPLRDAAGNPAKRLDDYDVAVHSGNADPPEFVSAVARDGVLTLTLDQPLDPVHTPVPAKFTLSQPVARSVTGVAVRGAAVELELSRWVSACSEPFTVSYAQGGEHEDLTLRNLSGTRVEELESKDVTIDDPERSWCPIVQGTVEGDSGADTVSMRLDRSLRRSPAPSVDGFAVRSDGGGGAPAGPVGVEEVGFPADPAGLTLKLKRTLMAGERLSVSYRAPRSGAGLRDADGNGAAPFSTETVVGAGAPAATEVAVASDPGGDAAYAAGDTVRVAVTFDEAVAVGTEDGTPRLGLDLGGEDGAGERWAVYEDGSGTATLTFAWTAAAPDEAPAGVAVRADTLELDGGTIASVATQADAALGHPGLDPDPAHRVDAVAPRLVRGEIDAGTVTLWFSEALDEGAAKGRFWVQVQTARTAADQFFARGEVSVDGAAVTVGLGEDSTQARPGLTGSNRATYLRRIDRAGGALRDLAGNLVPTPQIPGNYGVNPNRWRSTASVDLENVTGKTAAVIGAEVVTDAGSDGAWAAGGTVEAAVTFDAPVTVGTEHGVPTLALIANGGIRQAAYASGSGTERLVFAWRVAEADGSVAAPVRVAASGLKLAGGSIASAAGRPASLGFGEAPGVTAVSVGRPDGGRFEAGDTVEAVLTFAEPVTVEGAPSVGLVVEGAIRRAVYAAGSGTHVLAFRYTLGQGDGPWARAALAGNSLRLGGGSISSAGGGLAAALGHAGTGASGEAADPPAVIGVTVVSDAGGDDTYGLGERIRVRVAFSEAVAVTGSPGIAIDMDPADWGEKRAVYESGSGTDALVFVHEVVEPNLSTRGIAVLADTLILHRGATIRSAATRTDAALGHGGLDHDAAHKVDWRLGPATEASSGPPSVIGVEVVSDAGSDDTYLLGDTLRVRLAFSEAVRVTGTPRLSIDMDPAEWGTKRAAYEGARGTAALALTFAWTVVEPNWSPRGIAVLADSLVLDGGTIRSAATGAAAALGHAGLGHDAAHKVDWRPALSVADARGREGADEAVVFEVSLDRAFTTAAHSVTVDYATADGTAKAGEDYTATTGTLAFAAGERVKTVSVPILDDGHDEGHETFVLRLANVDGARAGDLEATGTIENTDRMPKAWLARFGRTVAEQVVTSVQARLDAPRAAGAQATLGGQALPSWTPGSGSAAGPGAANDDRIGGTAAAGFGGDAAARRDAGRLAQWLAGEDGNAREEARSMTGREVLSTTAFSLTVAPEEDGGASAALWGRGASSSFSGRDGPLRIDGEVTSATLGADWRSGSWLAGAMVKHSLGEGSYSGDGAGEVESALTGVYPYAAVDLSARLRAWATAGYGEGTLKLSPKNPETGAADPAIETDMSLGLGALGAKGNLVEPAGGSGLRLDVEADAFWVRTSSDAVRSAAGNLAAAQADVTRLRLGLDGGYAFALEGGATLEPRFELGLRHDGGDAETGYGLDVGGGLRWADPALGLSAEVSGRGLLAHEASGLSDRGLSGSLAWDPDPGSERGPSLTLTQTMGAQAAGGAHALLGRQTLADLAADDDGFEARRLELRLGYGLPAFGGRFTATPELGLALSDTGREVGLGWRLGLARRGPASFELGLKATRTEPANDTAPEHAIRLNLGVRF